MAAQNFLDLGSVEYVLPSDVPVNPAGRLLPRGPVEPKTPERAVQRFEHYELVTGEDGKS